MDGDDADRFDTPLVRPFLDVSRQREAQLVDNDDVVRPFLLTNGRAVGRSDLAYEAMVSLTPAGERALTTLRFEALAICELCVERPLAIAEIAAHLRIPLGSVRVLAGDLVADGYLDVHQGVTSISTDIALLRRLIHGVRAL